MTPGSYIREHLEHEDTLLSLCCGIGIELKKIYDHKRITAVDIVPEYIEEFSKHFPEASTVVSDVVKYIQRLPNNSFDLISCIDGVEHLPKTQGLKLLDECKRVARKKVLIFTPEGFTKNEPRHTWGIGGGDIHQRHLSGWEVKELEELGFKLIGSEPATSPHGQRFNESMYLYIKEENV